MLLEQMTSKEFRNATLLYSCALKEMATKIDIINDEFATSSKPNPIEHVKIRLKSVSSMAAKLRAKGLEPTFENAVENIDDIAGIRIICSFTPDIYKIAEIIGSRADITVIKAKDYIKNPKANGYRSLHMILGVPVFLTNEIKQTRVELQIRTIAMDFWASLEHKMRYKYKFQGSVPQNMNDELFECAEIAARLDKKMYELNRAIELSK